MPSIWTALGRRGFLRVAVFLLASHSGGSPHRRRTLSLPVCKERAGHLAQKGAGDSPIKHRWRFSAGNGSDVRAGPEKRVRLRCHNECVLLIQPDTPSDGRRDCNGIGRPFRPSGEYPVVDESSAVLYARRQKYDNCCTHGARITVQAARGVRELAGAANFAQRRKFLSLPAYAGRCRRWSCIR
jgi:hypothetical protein